MRMSTLLIQSNLGLEAGALEQGARDHYGDHHHHEELKWLENLSGVAFGRP